jgi:hypothetical protein
MQTSKTLLRDLVPGYQAAVDDVDPQQWTDAFLEFEDRNIYQTWPYEEVRSGLKNISHLIVKKSGIIVAIAQARIKKVPLSNLGAAYVRWGPLWRHSLGEADGELFTQVIRALKNEYVCKRGLLLRLFPLLYSDSPAIFREILINEGFKPVDTWPGRTLIVDLNPSLDELRKGLGQKWRNCLNSSEKQSLELTNGTSDELFDEYQGIYTSMLHRKKLPETATFNEFRRIQKELPETFKTKVFLCHADGKPCAGATVSAIGKIGIYLSGATNEIAMKNKASYFVQWKVMEWLKNEGFQFYDLHGINPERNPGTYRFKEGLCGKNGRDVQFLGFYDACENRLITNGLKVATVLNQTLRIVKKLIKK